MVTPYDELKAISDAKYAATKRQGWGMEMVAVLERHGIRLRGDDGDLWISTQ